MLKQKWFDWLAAWRALLSARDSMTIGAQAEALAADFLRQQRVRILARNVRLQGGEIDIIALHHGVILFVEVRLRSNACYGSAAESITPTKQRHLVHAARTWLATRGRQYANYPCRFDAILFERLDKNGISWVHNAFSADLLWR